ncbi:MAG: RsiV family protein [Minisyncoccia bacterium]
MGKKMILGGIFIVVILCGIIFYAAMRPSVGENNGAIKAPALEATSYTEHGTYYDIAVNYASSTALLLDVGSSANAAAVALMKKFVSDTIVQFKTDGNFANLTPDEIKTAGLSQSNKEALQINYLIGSSPHTVSYIFTIYEDTGGVHSNILFHTFTFDTSTGALLTLADIFMPGTSYLDTLSTISRARLPNVIGSGADMSFINNGTTPKDSNFENFFFDNQDFGILFPPYQVGPYAAGPQTLRIPLSGLSRILKSEYQ